MAVLPGLTPQEQQALSKCRLLPRRRGSGTQGERLSQTAGLSLEFRDFREYSDGDDLRHLDWNVLARLGHRVVRTYRDEQELKVTLVLDGSASMTIQEGAKWQTARSIAAALGSAALQGGDLLQSFLIGQGGSIRSLRGPSAMGKWGHWLAGIQPETQGSSFKKGCEAVASRLQAPGLTIVVSDGLEHDAESALLSLIRREQELWWIQVLDEEELNPQLTGDLELVDIDSGQARTCTVTEDARRDYLANLEGHCKALAAAAQRSGGKAMKVTAGTSVESLVKEVWRPKRWIG